MFFKVGDRVKLIEEQDVEDMSPVQLGDVGTVFAIEEVDGIAPMLLLEIDFDGYDEQHYWTWEWEVELVG